MGTINATSKHWLKSRKLVLTGVIVALVLVGAAFTGWGKLTESAFEILCDSLATILAIYVGANVGTKLATKPRSTAHGGANDGQQTD